jgi:hypothetical protein
MPGPDIWGPHGWRFLHYITLGYPNNPTQKDKDTYRNFIEQFKEIIPCEICKNHFKQNLLKHSLSDDIMSNKISFINWSIDMHNEVNKTNKKRILTYSEGLKEILKNCHGEDCNIQNEHFNNDKKTSNNYFLISIIIILVILLSISCIYIKYI